MRPCFLAQPITSVVPLVLEESLTPANTSKSLTYSVINAYRLTIIQRQIQRRGRCWCKAYFRLSRSRLEYIQWIRSSGLPFGHLCSVWNHGRKVCGSLGPLFLFTQAHLQFHGDHCCKRAQILRHWRWDPLRPVYEPAGIDQVGNCMCSILNCHHSGLTVAQLGHSAVDVNLIGYATRHALANLEKIRGNHDNTGEMTWVHSCEPC